MKIVGTFPVGALLLSLSWFSPTPGRAQSAGNAPLATTDSAAASLSGNAATANGGQSHSENLIDKHIFGRMQRDGVPAAPLATDAEFLRRVTMDLTGRLPEPDAVQKFLADKDPDKRDKLIDSLFTPIPTMGLNKRGPNGSRPYLDRWSYWFGDLFRSNEQIQPGGIAMFRNYLQRVLELNVPYDQFVRHLITASGISSWTDGSLNFVARNRVMSGDGYSEINHEDTADELALWSTKLFLGVSIECVSCHNGKGHLEKINLWLSKRQRPEVWRQAAFFGKTYVAPVYGRIPEFMVEDTAKGYDLHTQSVLRVPRYPADVTPTFMLTGEKYDPSTHESERETYARLLTTNPQFARATVNLFWAEFMGKGIVDPPFGFDPDRQDPANPPPAPWTIQPSNPELLNALADDFRKSGYDLRHLMKLITKSRAYQLSSYYPGEWKPQYEDYFARHIVRRIMPEQLWDAISQATGIFESFKGRYFNETSKYTLQVASSQDYDSSHASVFNILQDFGQTDRETLPTERSTMIQTATLLNHNEILERVKVKPGSRLEKLLKATPPKSNREIVAELFLATVSRPPTPAEEKMAIGLLEKGDREQGAEDLLWSLLNRMDFIFDY
jgi:Protein of unknown function (DUF1553)/Protein of unknown function (DUF1549)